MSLTGSPEELERQRMGALALLGEGLLPGEVAKRVGVDRRSVRRGRVPPPSSLPAGGARPTRRTLGALSGPAGVWSGHAGARGQVVMPRCQCAMGSRCPRALLRWRAWVAKGFPARRGFGNRSAAASCRCLQGLLLEKLLDYSQRSPPGDKSPRGSLRRRSSRGGRFSWVAFVSSSASWRRERCRTRCAGPDGPARSA